MALQSTVKMPESPAAGSETQLASVAASAVVAPAVIAPPVEAPPVEAPPVEAPPVAAPEPSAREIRDWLKQQLARPLAATATLVVTVPAPRVDPETLLEVSSRRLGVVWDPPDGLAFAGVGATHRIELEGPEPLERLRSRASGVWSQLTTRNHPACMAVTPRLYGGVAFDPHGAREEPWQEFGSGCFTLPRIGYSTDGQRASLSLAVRGNELTTPEQRLAWVTEVDALRSLMQSPLGADLTRDRLSAVRAIHRTSQDLWHAEVEAIVAGIRDGAFQKIVAARSSRVELMAPLETAAVLRRLSRGLRSSTRFAFCRRRSTFIGATPERLITRRGRSIATEALAGSIASGAEGAGRLLRSDKDLGEHQLVVDELVRRLGPLCQHLEVDPHPRVRELRDVMHLLTPISGTLAEPRHVLELVEELHPTPAVGGVPTETAMRWISRHETFSRGWYAAPVGWFDAQGDGDFAVALRSCVLRGSEAFLFAGAGIVGDSDPRSEYIETELKEQALLTALGA
ncbi:MAG: isochorismate synthase [Acidobacteriota bacterium]